MKIAVPVTGNNQIDSHFGHCEYYSIFSVNESNEIENIQTLKSEQGCGCKSNIAGILAQNGVTVMLAGGIGRGAINVLHSAGIQVIRGCSGNPEEVVRNYLAGSITDSGISCKHHEHHSEGAQHVCNPLKNKSSISINSPINEKDGSGRIHPFTKTNQTN